MKQPSVLLEWLEEIDQPLLSGKRELKEAEWLLYNIAIGEYKTAPINKYHLERYIKWLKEQKGD